MSRFFDFHTGLSSAEAAEAAEIFPRLVQVNDIGGKRVTDANLCKKIYKNSILRLACERRKISYQAPSLGFRLAHSLLGLFHFPIFLFCMPAAIVTGIYAQFVLSNRMAALRPISQDEKDALRDAWHARNDPQKTVSRFLSEISKTEVQKRSGSSLLTTFGETDGLNSCYYDPIFHRVSLPERIVKEPGAAQINHSAAPASHYPPMGTGDNVTPAPPLTVGQKAFAFKMAIAAHECGHAEQRKFLIAWTVTSLVAAVASLLVFLFVPFPALILSSLLLFIGIIVLVTPLITFAYEVNASQRAIVNLIAYQYLTTGGEAREAAHTLQLAASTYLLNLVIFLFQFTAQLLTLLAKFRSP